MKQNVENNIAVVFTGLVREEELFKKSIIDFYNLKKEGLLEKIAISTWKDEIDKYKGLRDFLTSHNVEMIETDEPKIHGPSHIWCQMKTLDEALNKISDDFYVLKTRPDVYINPKFVKKLFLEKNHLLKINSNAKYNIFSNKIWLISASLDAPFYIIDICFFGKCRDLKLMVNYNTIYDEKYNFDIHKVHIRRFMEPFRDKFSIFDYCFKNNGGIFGKGPCRAELFNYKAKNDFFIRVFLTYYYILDTYFYINGDEIKNQIIFRNVTYPFNRLNSSEFCLNNYSQIIDPPETKMFIFNGEWIKNLILNKVSIPGEFDLFRDILTEYIKNNSWGDFKLNKDVLKKYSNEIKKIFINCNELNLIGLLKHNRRSILEFIKMIK